MIITHVVLQYKTIKILYFSIRFFGGYKNILMIHEKFKFN